MKNINSKEVDKFDNLSSKWWDKEGPLKTLHSVNKARIMYIMNKYDLCQANILDVGCGAGILTESFYGLCKSITGIDTSKSNIDIANSRAQKYNLNINYIHTDIESYDFNKKFDVITCLEVLEHVPDINSIITSCKNNLSPNGSLFISTINKTPQSFILSILAAEFIMNLLPKGTHHYNNFIRPSKLMKILHQHQLKVNSINGIFYNPLTNLSKITNSVSNNYILKAIPYCK